MSRVMNQFQLKPIHKAILAVLPMLTLEQADGNLGWNRCFTGDRLWKALHKERGLTYAEMRNAVRSLLRKDLIRFRRKGYDTVYFRLPPELPFS